jgi:ubiquinone/menaquinone biosynthesis C-methylase UbiE
MRNPKDFDAWVYNKMVDAYAARPSYPEALIERIAALACAARARVVDVGAGIGHLSLPLAERGHEVCAVEPALGMLESLQARASAAGLAVRAVHAAAESLPLRAASTDLVVLADALHFMDAARVGHELARILSRCGRLAYVEVAFADSPFMTALAQIMRDAAPRRPRATRGLLAELAALAGVQLSLHERFEQRTPLDDARLLRILSSISYIGPAMNPERTEAFRARVRAIPYPPEWHTLIVLHAGQRGAGPLGSA